jgi:hypothetical protein
MHDAAHARGIERRRRVLATRLVQGMIVDEHRGLRGPSPRTRDDPRRGEVAMWGRPGMIWVHPPIDDMHPEWVDPASGCKPAWLRWPRTTGFTERWNSEVNHGSAHPWPPCPSVASSGADPSLVVSDQRYQWTLVELLDEAIAVMIEFNPMYVDAELQQSALLLKNKASGNVVNFLSAPYASVEDSKELLRGGVDEEYHAQCFRDMVTYRGMAPTSMWKPDTSPQWALCRGLHGTPRARRELAGFPFTYLWKGKLPSLRRGATEHSVHRMVHWYSTLIHCARLRRKCVEAVRASGGVVACARARAGGVHPRGKRGIQNRSRCKIPCRVWRHGL